MNDREREMWTLNDESLYDWWKSTRLSMRNFLRKHRTELDEAIQKALNPEPKHNRYY